MHRKVNFGDKFVRDIKSLQKRFPLMELDVREFKREIESGEILGDHVTGVGALVYKARLPNRSARRGKSGGFRLLYVLHDKNSATFLHIYSKSDKNDVTTREIRRILQGLAQQD